MITQLIKALGWSILHSLWQGAVIYAFLFLAFMMFFKKQSNTKHNIAFGALMLTFLSFCVTFFAIFEMPTPSLKSADIALNQFIMANVSQSSNGFIAKAEAYFPILAIVYLVGLLMQTFVLTTGYVKLKRLKKHFLTAIPAEWNPIFESTLKTLGIKKNVSFYLSPKINVPLVIGFFKPVVLFPIAMATQLDIKHVEAILIHELSHIRRNDYLLNLVKTTVEIVMFFNPFVWLTTKLINVERENACDDLVVSVTQTPVTYAHALLNIELLKNKETPALSLAVSGQNHHLYQRIKRITNMKSNYINMKQHALILTLAVTTVVSLAWINPTKKQEVKKKNSLKSITLEPKNIQQISFRADTDSVKVKEKMKIIITGKDGVEKVYHSMKEVPDSIKKKFRTLNSPSVFSFDSAGLAKLKDGSFNFEFRNQFDSPEFHLKMEKFGKDMEKMGKDMDKQFNSPEFKAKFKAMEDHFNSPEFKAKMKEAESKYNSPEVRAHIDSISKRAYSYSFNSEVLKEKLADARKRGEESRKKSEELRKLYKSDEYKKLREKYEKDLEKLKKKNGISTEKALLLMDSDVATTYAFTPMPAQNHVNLSFAGPAKALATTVVNGVALPIAGLTTDITKDVVSATSSLFTTTGDVKEIKILTQKEAKEKKEKQ